MILPIEYFTRFNTDISDVYIIEPKEKKIYTSKNTDLTKFKFTSPKDLVLEIDLRNYSISENKEQDTYIMIYPCVDKTNFDRLKFHISQDYGNLKLMSIIPSKLNIPYINVDLTKKTSFNLTDLYEKTDPKFMLRFNDNKGCKGALHIFITNF